MKKSEYDSWAPTRFVLKQCNELKGPGAVYKNFKKKNSHRLPVLNSDFYFISNNGIK